MRSSIDNRGEEILKEAVKEEGAMCCYTIFFSFLFFFSLTKFYICKAIFKHMWSHKLRHVGHVPMLHSTL